MVFGELYIVQHEVQEGSCNDDGGEHTDANADGKGERKPLDNVGSEGATETEQDQTSDPGRKVRVTDRRHGPRPTTMD